VDFYQHALCLPFFGRTLSTTSCVFFLFAWLPTFCNDVLGLLPEAQSAVLAVPCLVGLGSSLLTAGVARRVELAGSFSTLRVRQRTAFMAFFGQSASVMFMGLASGVMSFSLACTAEAFFAACQGPGFIANYVDLPEEDQGVVVGIGSTVATVFSWLGARIVTWLLPDDKRKDRAAWTKVFAVFSATSLTGLLYVGLCSTSIAVA